MAGTVVLTSQYNRGAVKAAVITATADASAATFPAVTLASLGLDISGTLLAIATNPGATAPTDDYDITLVDGDGLDRLNGAGMNRDTTTSERAMVGALVYQGEALTLTIAGNAVNSAVLVITLYWDPTVAQTAVPTGQLTTITVTPTLDTSAFVSGDVLATAVIAFASAVPAGSLAGYVEKLVLVDKDVQSAAGELWLFSATVTPAAANAAHSISDADAALCIGVIPFGGTANPYYASALNSVCPVKGLNLAILCAATTLYGILVTRGTPTYTSAGLVLKLTIAQA